ncbi:MAG: hypothetical protein DSY40_03290 [Nautilia sp.]|nr:MAG: hypothetical protein DSY40_03290 [Nautilia sp.]
MKKKLLFLIIALFLITGCETKITNLLKTNNKQITIMENTQRGQIINALDTIALINATYLNPTLNENNLTAKKYEIFLVGVYNSNDPKSYEKGGIHNPNYQLTLNDSNYERAEKANPIKMQLETYPFYNAWMKYYIVYFPKTDSDKLVLEYKNKEFGATKLIFKKNKE